jgi:hypothetical protein
VCVYFPVLFQPTAQDTTVLEKLLVPERKFPASYPTRSFITVLQKSPQFVAFRGLMNPIHDLPSHIFKNKFIIFLPCSLVLPSCHFPSPSLCTTKNDLITSDFPTRTLQVFLFSPYLPHSAPFLSCLQSVYSFL